MKYYVGTKTECLQADSIISQNCGWPAGSTTNWANPRQITDGRYVIEAPVNGHGKFSAETMMEGVSLEIIENPEFPEVEEGL